MLFQVVEFCFKLCRFKGAGCKLLFERSILCLSGFEKGFDGGESYREVADGGVGGGQLFTHGFNAGRHGLHTGCQRLRWLAHLPQQIWL